MFIKFIKIIIKIWNAIRARFSGPQDDTPPSVMAVELAKQEWLHAQRMYNVVTEPELIDYAIYLIKANEVKYMYLLRQVKEQGMEALPVGLEFFEIDNSQVARDV